MEGIIWIVGTLVVAGIWIVSGIYKSGTKQLTQGFLEGRGEASAIPDTAELIRWREGFEARAAANRVLKNGDVALKQEGMVLAGIIHQAYLEEGHDQWTNCLENIKYYHRELVVTPQYQVEMAMRNMSPFILQNIAETGEVPPF